LLATLDVDKQSYKITTNSLMKSLLAQAYVPAEEKEFDMNICDICIESHEATMQCLDCGVQT
jgi:hypothetical protein